MIDLSNHVAPGNNRNPHLAWNEIPVGTESFVLICHDPDVPSQGDDVNTIGREVPRSLPRVDSFHWLLLDLPSSTREIGAGSQSSSITPRDKPGPGAPGGLRHGINDFTTWFAGDSGMAGTYYGYDGPCPPWNDAQLHHSIFTLYALGVRRLETHGDFAGAGIRIALTNSVLATAQLTGVNTLNSRLRLLPH
jgi:Raf kinase inhibitor-like YbhB/YbcL family protein